MSGARAYVEDYNNGSLVIAMSDASVPFIAGELVVGSNSGAQWIVDSFKLAKGYI